MSFLKTTSLKDLTNHLTSEWTRLKDLVRNFFVSNSKTSHDKVKLGLFLVGVWYLTPTVLTLLRDIYGRLTANSLKNIQQRYLYSDKIKTEESKSVEMHSWVVVTGASDGIGRAYSLLFGSLGFNVVLVSRSQAKLVDVAGILETKYKVHTRIIQIDFAKSFTHEEIEQKVYQQVKDLDISILVNNVGIGGIMRFEKLSYKSIYDLIHINIHSYVYVTYVLIQKLKERAATRKAAIINVSSGLGNGILLPGFGCYPASKNFGIAFSQTLANEFPNIDILAVSAGRVKTNFGVIGEDRDRVQNKDDESDDKKRAITPEEHVRGVIKYLGREKVTTGSASHTFQERMMRAAGPTAMGFLGKKVMKRVDEENEKKAKNPTAL